MKPFVRASLVQLDTAWLDPATNATRMTSFAQAEADAGVELVVFPELANVGYFWPPHGYDAAFAARYRACAEAVPGPTTNRLVECASETGLHIAVGLLERAVDRSDVVYNAMVLLGPGGVIGTYRKCHLPRFEKLHFTPGSRLPIFDTPLGVVGMSICYDGRFPELSRSLALQGAEIICSGWAGFRVPQDDLDDSPLGLSDDNLRHRAYTRAQENAIYYLACNRAGVEGDTLMLGRSVVAGPNGEIVAESGTADEDVIRCLLSEELRDEVRAFLPVMADRRSDLYGSLNATPRS